MPGARGVVRRLGASVLFRLRHPTGPLRPLPDFVIVGAQKAGTTSLYAALCKHPDVDRAFRKEVHFFDTDHYPDVSWYRRHFPIHRSGTITGESSPYYIVHPAVPRRMAGVIPDARIIAILRDPVTRAISQYHHSRRHHFEARPIETALDPDEQDELAPASDEAWYDHRKSPARERSYLARGRYAEQLERWFAEFDRDQVLVLDSDELERGTAIPIAQQFLGLDPQAVRKVPQRNVGSYEPPAADVVARLREYFAPYDARLPSVAGRSFSWI